MIRMSDVSMEYDNGVRAVKKATLRIDEGEFVFLVGPSGSGKSTLIKLLTGEVKPTSGRIVVNNYNIGAIKKREIPYLRRTLGVVFQDFRLIEKKTVYENVAFAMRAVGAKNRAIRKRVPYVLELVGLAEKADTRPLELSGGEQQRVAIARALVNDPRLIIADEPTGNLDPARSYELMTLFEKINELGTTILIVTHEKELVDEFEKRVIMIDSGEIVSDARGRYYADDEYYDDAYVDEQVQENVTEQPQTPVYQDTSNASLTMLFERLNAKKVEDTEQIAQTMSQDTKVIAEDDIDDAQKKAENLSNEYERSESTPAYKLQDTGIIKDDIQMQAAKDIQMHMAHSHMTHSSQTEDIKQEENQTNDEKEAQIVQQNDDAGNVEIKASDEHENAQTDDEKQTVDSEQAEPQPEAENAAPMPDLSQISSRMGMNTSMMKRKQPQRVKTTVGSVDASLEELIQRFEQRVGIHPSQSQSKKLDNLKQAGGETENEQKNAENEASEQ